MCWGKHSIALSLLLSPCLWNVNFPSVAQSACPLGGTGWLEWTRVGYFPSPTRKVTADCNVVFPLPLGQLGSDNSPEG